MVENLVITLKSISVRELSDFSESLNQLVKIRTNSKTIQGGFPIKVVKLNNLKIPMLLHVNTFHLSEVEYFYLHLIFK